MSKPVDSNIHRQRAGMKNDRVQMEWHYPFTFKAFLNRKEIPLC